MAQTGFTPIQLYSTSTAAAAPSASNLTNSTLGSELAINITDGKLFYKDNANAVQVIAWKTTPTTAGGTGLTSYTAGDMLYYASGTVLTKLAIGASGRYLSSSGTAPQWNAPGALTEVDDTNVTLTLGGSPSTALLSAVSLTLGWSGQLAVSRGGTGLSSFTANGIVYASSTSALATGSALTFDGTNFATTGKGKFGTTVGVGAATPAASGAGITFPATQSASSDANTLDDYEEGTWTPSVGGTATYAHQIGTYRKIGGLVYASYSMAITLVGTGSVYGLTNLPFTSATRTEPYFGYSGNFTSLATAVYFLYSYNDAGTTNLNHGGTTGSSATSVVPIVVCGNGTILSGTIVYPAT